MAHDKSDARLDQLERGGGGTVGAAASSTATSFKGCPRTPPSWFSARIASSTATRFRCPDAARGPVNGLASPILISPALAGSASSAAATVSRRPKERDMASTSGLL